jgi:hypothetical protein
MVVIAIFADIHIVKLSRMRTWALVLGETRSMPCVSIPLSSGISTVSRISEAIERTLLVLRQVMQHLYTAKNIYIYYDERNVYMIPEKALHHQWSRRDY